MMNITRIGWGTFLLCSLGCANQVVDAEPDPGQEQEKSLEADGDLGAIDSDHDPKMDEDGDEEDDGRTTDGSAAGPNSPPACPAIEELSPIATNEGPFTLCEADGDCSDGHFCYGNEGQIGFCQVGDADIWCDGEGDVNLQTVPALSGWDTGVCVYADWRDYLCCAFPDDWDCSSVVTPAPSRECETVSEGKPAADQCEATFDCGDQGLLEVLCDGENDGTNTSLCECTRDGVPVDAVYQGLYPGEDASTCVAASVDCLVE